MDNSKQNTDLTLLTQKLLKDEVATPVAIGSVGITNIQIIGCLIPVDEIQVLVILNSGDISVIEPVKTSQQLLEKFKEIYTAIRSDPIIYENFEKALHNLYFGLSGEIDVTLRNDRNADLEKLKNLISLAAQKSHEHSQYKEKLKLETVDFLLNRFTIPSINDSHLINTAQNTQTPAQDIKNEYAYLPTIDDDIKISELGKNSDSLYQTLKAVNQNTSQIV